MDFNGNQIVEVPNQRSLKCFKGLCTIPVIFLEKKLYTFLLPQAANSPFIQAPTVHPEPIPERPAKLPLCPLAPKPSPIPNKESEPQTVKPSSTPYNPQFTLPICEHYFRERGYDFKISNGRVVVYKPEIRKRRRRRQGQVKLEMTDKQTVQVIMLQN